MNPLDWNGPAFLLFYFCFGTALAIGLYRVRRWMEAGLPSRPLDLKDPYRIALLRGGEAEAVRVAMVHLLERGDLRGAGGGEVERPSPGSDHLKHPLERAVARCFTAALKPRVAVAKQQWLRAEVHHYRDELQADGLFVTGDQRWRRFWLVLVAWAMAGGLAWAKISIGLERGKPVTYLEIMAVALAVILLCVGMIGRRTPAGDRAVASAKSLFVRPLTLQGTSPAEIAMLAAVFGLGVLPADGAADYQAMFPRAQQSAYSSSCGSGCGSSCGGGGGGGCGGGGCGGCGGGGD